MLPSSSVWAAAMSVMIDTSGRIIPASVTISFGELMPASTTANLWAAGSRRVSVSGTPIWLFKLPSVA